MRVPWRELINEVESIEQPFKFSSEYADTETGLIYYNYRYYNPENGKWLKRDPIAEQGGLNLYGFVNNDSISNIDLLGALSFNKRDCNKIEKRVSAAIQSILEAFALNNENNIIDEVKSIKRNISGSSITETAEDHMDFLRDTISLNIGGSKNLGVIAANSISIVQGDYSLMIATEIYKLTGLTAENLKKKGLGPYLGKPCKNALFELKNAQDLYKYLYEMRNKVYAAPINSKSVKDDCPKVYNKLKSSMDAIKESLNDYLKKMEEEVEKMRVRTKNCCKKELEKKKNDE
ncbi:RHS repeat-associated core domain-containing protein [Lentisphaerota bacterium WC36G]|nr:RHS repeat-associated core domain-containing protein [Lentisphaerae bacterium WC36]